MRRSLLLAGPLLLAASAGPRPAGAPPRSFVGLDHPPLPAGAVVRAGALVSAVGAPGPEYGLTHVRAGGRERLWLDSLAAPARRGVAPRRRVVDELLLPVVPRGYGLVLQACRLRGRPDRAVAAVVRRDTAELLTHVRAAWRADLAARRLRPIPPTGVGCENEGYGL